MTTLPWREAGENHYADGTPRPWSIGVELTLDGRVVVLTSVDRSGAAVTLYPATAREMAAALLTAADAAEDNRSQT